MLAFDSFVVAFGLVECKSGIYVFKGAFVGSFQVRVWNGYGRSGKGLMNAIEFDCKKKNGS